MSMQNQILFRACHFIAHQHEFHPVKDYLNSLTWDNTPRIEKVLSKYLGVKENTYTEAVSKKMLCAAVARVFEPGIKFDYVPILEGKQGIGKSTFIKTLAGQWFGDNINSFKGKEAVEAMMGVWIVELSELEAFGKSEIEGIKSFISRTVDRARLAYGIHARQYPRRCVFIGTTNDVEYLKDDTGNRRFWPVKCEVDNINIKGLKRERDQLWAEAVTAYKNNEPLFLSESEEAMATQEQELRVPDEGWVGAISVWLDELIPADYYDSTYSRQGEFGEEMIGTMKRNKTCTAEIWTECLGAPLKELNTSKRKQIGRAIRQIKGWERSTGTVRFGKRYGKVGGFVRVSDKEETT